LERTAGGMHLPQPVIVANGNVFPRRPSTPIVLLYVFQPFTARTTLSPWKFKGAR